MTALLSQKSAPQCMKSPLKNRMLYAGSCNSCHSLLTSTQSSEGFLPVAISESTCTGDAVNTTSFPSMLRWGPRPSGGQSVWGCWCSIRSGSGVQPFLPRRTRVLIAVAKVFDDSASSGSGAQPRRRSSSSMPAATWSSRNLTKNRCTAFVSADIALFANCLSGMRSRCICLRSARKDIAEAG